MSQVKLSTAPLEVFRPVEIGGWQTDVVESALEAAPGNLAFTNPEHWRVEYLSPPDRERLSLGNEEHAAQAKSDLESFLATTGFHAPLPVLTRGGTAIGRLSSRIIIKLHPDLELLTERYAAIDALPWRGGYKPVPNENFYFQITIGTLRNKHLKTKLRHALTDALPKAISLSSGFSAVYF